MQRKDHTSQTAYNRLLLREVNSNEFRKLPLSDHRNLSLSFCYGPTFKFLKLTSSSILHLNKLLFAPTPQTAVSQNSKNTIALKAYQIFKERGIGLDASKSQAESTNPPSIATANNFDLN